VTRFIVTLKRATPPPNKKKKKKKKWVGFFSEWSKKIQIKNYKQKINV